MHGSEDEEYKGGGVSSEAYLMKTPGGYVLDSGEMPPVKVGGVIKGVFTRPRNYRFHKKLFALLDIGFDAFEPEEREYKGLPVQKNFERFRKDVTVATGYYDVAINLKGDVKAEAKSISFGSMSEDDFEKLYSAVIDVLMQKVLKNYTREDIDRVVDEIMRFT